MKLSKIHCILHQSVIYALLVCAKSKLTDHFCTVDIKSLQHLEKKKKKLNFQPLNSASFCWRYVKFSSLLQVVFVSWCKSFWDCGLVALDDISLSLGSCQAAGKTMYICCPTAATLYPS